MFCKNCGAQISDSTLFCEHCGTQVSTAAPQQPQQPVYQQPVYQQPQQPVYQQPVYQQPQQPVYQSAPQSVSQPAIGAELPMKWFKFLIYFSLFAGAVLNLVTGIMAMTGGQYEAVGGNAELVYRIMPDLQVVDMIYGVALLALAAFAVYVRMRLAGFYENGPKMLTVLYALSLAFSLIYLIAASSILAEKGGEIDFSSQAPNIAMSVAMIVCNITYFNKRSHLFVNK